MIEEELIGFSRSLSAEVRDRAESDHLNSAVPQSVFTQLMVDDLGNIGELEGGEVCYSEKSVKRKLARVDGYACSDDGDRLDLFVTIYRAESESVEVSRAEADRALQEAWRFFSGAFWGDLSAGDEGHDDYDMLCRIRDLGPGREQADKLERLRVFLFTNGVVPEGKKYDLPSEEGDFKRSVQVWDLRRLHRTRGSGATREPIEVDFEATTGAPLPCLEMSPEQGDYRAFLAVLPGVTLQKLYDEHGERLLEMNVRSFLQARGKVNSKIRETLLKAPGRFFAYNNGLTAIAEGVELTTPPAAPGIKKLHGLQIVNGGQTTASIHRAAKRDKADLSSVNVQLKLSVVKAELVDEIVPLISRNANSQNKVNEPDFSANHPWHQRLEELSRTVWTPDGASQWFYERARGQYQVAKFKAGATKQFEKRWPAAQVFTKTDVASAENTWDQLPHTVSLGGQKNFLKFTDDNSTEHSAENVASFSDKEFQELVARQILFRAAQGVVRDLKFPAYRANIVTYALAYLVYRRGTRIDLHRIWRDQSAPESLLAALKTISSAVAVALRQSAGARNVTEWCKRAECWDAVKKLSLDVPQSFWADGPKPVGSATGASVKAVSRKSKTVVSDDEDSEAEPAETPRELEGLNVVDNRSEGGDLWVIGDAKLAPRMATLRGKGFLFTYQVSGNPATGRRPAWKLRS